MLTDHCILFVAIAAIVGAVIGYVLHELIDHWRYDIEITEADEDAPPPPEKPE